jgi:hypothetical protein
MSQVDEMDEGQLKILDKVEKLLRLAGKAGTPEEAATATAKAQELLVAYNLSSELVGKTGSAADAKREQQKIKGGMYEYQRYLWGAVAELNFCHHFTRQERAIRNRIRIAWDGSKQRYEQTFWQHQHCIIGKRVNARLTVTMAQYLEQAIERLVMARYPLNSQRFMREAIAFREGMSDELYWRLTEKRRQLVAEEEARRQRNAAAAGVSTSQALSIGSLAQQEDDANWDFRVGEEGWSAKKRQERAARAEASRRAEEEYTRWAAANPEEAAKEEKKRAKEAKRYRNSGGPGSRGGMSGAEKRQNTSEYWQGRDAGKKIGLDPQTADRRTEQRRLK